MAPCNGTLSTPQSWSSPSPPTIAHYNGTLRWHPTMAPRPLPQSWSPPSPNHSTLQWHPAMAPRPLPQSWSSPSPPNHSTLQWHPAMAPSNGTTSTPPKLVKTPKARFPTTSPGPVAFPEGTHTTLLCGRASSCETLPWRDRKSSPSCVVCMLTWSSGRVAGSNTVPFSMPEVFFSEILKKNNLTNHPAAIETSKIHSEYQCLTLTLLQKSPLQSANRKKKTCDIPWNTACLNRDPYNGLLWSKHNWVV